MTPATLLNPQGKVAEPWNRVGVLAFDVDPYSGAAIMFYNLRAEIEQVLGGSLHYVLRRFM
jgi:hypothetical protein